jgi:Family of unknown function (DUF6194)
MEPTVTEKDLIDFVSSLPDVHVVTAGPDTGGPEIAWGDTFFSRDPEGKFPFATIVTKDYPGFDTASDLDRPGVYRVNVGVGRRRYQELFGHGPEAHAEHRDDYDYTAADRVIPHPVYAVQSWISVVNPGPATADQLRDLLTEAHSRAGRQHR